MGKLSAGTAYNAVAEYAELEGTTRTLLPETRAHVRASIEAAAEHISVLFGGTAQVEWDDFAAPLLNDALACEEPQGPRPLSVSRQRRTARFLSAATTSPSTCCM